MTAENSIENPVLKIQNLSVYYAGFCAVKNVSLDVPAKSVTAMIGPSGCGKSTLLRSINRMNELLPDVKTEGTILFNHQNIYEKKVDVVDLRKKIGMVFQRPNPFPTSIFRNVAWGPTINGFEGDIEELVENSLKKAALWDEVKDKLKKNGLTLSGGQQQRLCIARAIAMQPEIILMDEPCSALDPISSSHIEDLLIELKDLYSIIIVTHNMQQAARVSNRTAFMYQGELIEYDYTNVIFTRPKKKQTEDYVTGKFG